MNERSNPRRLKRYWRSNPRRPRRKSRASSVGSTPTGYSFCSSSLFLDFSWTVLDDLYGSDHYPTILASSLPPPSNSTPRWALGRADWNEFSTLCNELIIDAECLEANDPMKHFINLVIHIADKSIPKTSTSPRKGKLWLDDDCRKAIRKRKQALRKVEFHPSPENLSIFRQGRAETRKTIRNYKKSSWREYVSKLKSKTPMNKIWKMVRKISGKTSPQPIHLFSKNNSLQTSSIEETSNIMDETFQHCLHRCFQTAILHLDSKCRRTRSCMLSLMDWVFSRNPGELF